MECEKQINFLSFFNVILSLCFSHVFIFACFLFSCVFSPFIHSFISGMFWTERGKKVFFLPLSFLDYIVTRWEIRFLIISVKSRAEHDRFRVDVDVLISSDFLQRISLFPNDNTSKCNKISSFSLVFRCYWSDLIKKYFQLFLTLKNENNLNSLLLIQLKKLFFTFFRSFWIAGKSFYFVEFSIWI